VHDDPATFGQGLGSGLANPVGTSGDENRLHGTPC
jgi:hypothetical protein